MVPALEEARSISWGAGGIKSFFSGSTFVDLPMLEEARSINGMGGAGVINSFLIISSFLINGFGSMLEEARSISSLGAGCINSFFINGSTFVDVLEEARSINGVGAGPGGVGSFLISGFSFFFLINVGSLLLEAAVNVPCFHRCA